VYSLAKVVNPCKAFMMVPLGAVFFGMKVQNWPPMFTKIPPYSANVMSRANLFSHAIRLVASNCSAIPLMASLVQLQISVGYNRYNWYNQHFY
jgi:hypothetical protein